MKAVLWTAAVSRAVAAVHYNSVYQQMIGMMLAVGDQGERGEV